jgi:hypothetical protein
LLILMISTFILCMKNYNVIKQLNNSESSFLIDWDEMDEDKFMEVIHHQKSYLVSNLTDGVAQFMKSSSSEVHKNIEDFILSHDFDAVSLAEKAGYLTHVSIKFFPRTEKIETVDGMDAVPYSSCVISDDTKNSLKVLSKGQPESEYFEIKLELDKTNAYLYQEFNNLNEELNEIKSKTARNSLSASFLIASSVFATFFASPDFKVDLDKVFNNKSSVEISVKNVNSYSSKLNDSLHSLNSDLNDSIISKYVPTFKDLSSTDLNQAISFVNHKGHTLGLQPSEAHSFDEKVEEIVTIISEVYGKQPNDNIRLIASAIAKETESHHLDYKMMLSIIKVESSFDQSTVSSSGDLSVAQVNYEHWDPEFKRLHYPKLDKEKLKTDISYSVKIMADILSILKKRHQKDALWYARYHSGTPSKKIAYAHKVSNELHLIESNEVLNSKEKITALISELHNLKHNNEKISQEKVDDVIVNLTYLNSQIDWKIKEEIKFKTRNKGQILASNSDNSSI